MENERILHTTRGLIPYWRIGDAEQCIIFTHGMTMDHHMFDRQVKYFQERYTVIVWDVPLHGKARPYQDFSLKHTADDLKGIMLQEKIQQAHLVGQSMGGYILQEFAISFSQMVSSLTFVDSNPFGQEYYTKIDRWMLSNVALLSKWYPYNMLIKSIATSISSTSYGQQIAMEALKKLKKREIIYVMDRVYKELMQRKEKFRFKVPTVLIYGEDDKTGKVIAYNRQWAKNDGYPIHEIPQAAHNANVDNADRFNKILHSFLISID